MTYFSYSFEKDSKLKTERNISFEEIISLITEGYIIDVLEHPNPSQYPNQKIYILDIEGYIWLVPFVKNGEEIFLKTAFPSRKHTQQYRENLK
jgi:hypothetical protein